MREHFVGPSGCSLEQVRSAFRGEPGRCGCAGQRRLTDLPLPRRWASLAHFTSIVIAAVVWLSAVVCHSPVTATPLFEAGFRSFPAGGGALSVAIGDFTHDGRPDVIVANSRTSTVSMLASQPDGSLDPPVLFGTGPDGSAAVVVGDVNGDGLLDVIYCDGISTDSFSSVGVLLGLAGGGFSPAVTYPVQRGAKWVTLCDMNGDGTLDILAANSDPFYSHSISILFGDGHGSFGSRRDIDFAVTPGVGVSLTCVVAGDLNGDGRNDMVAAGPGGTVVYVRLANADGTFQSPVAYNVGASGQPIALADVNGDGHLDIVSGGSSAAVILGNGDGTFSPPRFLGVGGGMPAVADLNHDGIPDIALTEQTSVAVLLGTGGGNFANPIEYPTGFAAVALAIGDVNGDGLPDIVTANDYSNTVSVLLGNGEGGFGAGLTYPVGATPLSADAGDLNSDGLVDLAVANRDSGTVSLLAGHGDGTFEASFTLGAGLYPGTVRIRDLNHDGIPDLVFGGAGVTVLLGSGGMNFGPARTYEDSIFFTGVAVADLNGDGIPDIAATRRGTSVGSRPPDRQYIPGVLVYVFLGAGDGTFVRDTAYAVGRDPFDPIVADVNGDGHPDLVVTNAGDSTISVLLADKNGRLQSQVSYATAGGGIALAVADFNGDGAPDVIVASQSQNQLVLLRGHGDGTFSSPSIVGSTDAPQALSVADLDRDGHADLIVSTSYRDGVTILRGRGDGTFASGEIYGTGNEPEAVAIGDFNGDGYPDLAVPNSGSGNVTILRSTVGRATPVLVSLAGVDVSSERVSVRWWSESVQGAQARVERSPEGVAWMDLGQPKSDGNGMLTFVDRNVHEGDSYVYRLRVTDLGSSYTAGQTAVHVPIVAELELAVTPNPAVASALLTFHLAAPSEARMEVLDITGRKVWSEQLGQFGPGRHAIELPLRAVHPGIYLVRLSQAQRTITRRMVVVR
jgi:FG-GAP-like repeat/FG-GAP repeat